MRFDDRLTTVLAGDVPAGSAAVAQYRQLIDILGQIASDEMTNDLAPALARIHALRASVSDADRLLSVQCLSGRLVSPVLLRYLASEKPGIASAAIRAARLDDDAWAGLVPSLPTRARGFLRNRRDLGARTRLLLDQLGLYDTALPDGQAPTVPVVDAIAVAQQGAATTAETAEMPGHDISVPVVSAGAPDAAEAQQIGPTAPSMPVAANDAASPQSIGEIVKRIEALQEVRFRQAMDERSVSVPEDLSQSGDVADNAESLISPSSPPMPSPLELEPEGDPQPPQQFQFATGVDGAIITASGIALGAVYGLSLALPALPGMRGVDASVATAFSRRMPVRGGRTGLGMAADLVGEWRIDADPCFDRASGRFTGYSGTVRRPMPWESAGQESGDTALTGRDGLRQIVHELRTPLNAIMGFSEIIEQQLFGPVTREYRDMALRIGQDARQLLNGFDDLDTALRLDRNAIDDPQGCVALDDLLERLSGRVQPLLAYAGASLNIAPVPAQVLIAMSPQALDRILPRLTGALIGSCRQGEELHIAFAEGDGTMALIFSRPDALAGLDDAQLFDVDRQVPGLGSGGPLLGLGFCLRLVRNLVVSHAGRLQVLPDALCLTLPVARISADEAMP